MFDSSSVSSSCIQCVDWSAGEDPASLTLQSKVSEGHASSRHSEGIAVVERSVPSSERMQVRQGSRWVRPEPKNRLLNEVLREESRTAASLGWMSSDPPLEVLAPISASLVDFAHAQRHAASVRLGLALDDWVGQLLSVEQRESGRRCLEAACQLLAETSVPTRLMLTALMLTRAVKSELPTRMQLVDAAHARLSSERSGQKAEAILRGLR